MLFTAWLLACMLFITPTTQSQTLRKATGGTGLYKNEIGWLDFTGITLTSASAPITQTYNLEGGLYSLVVTIDNVSFSGFNTAGNSLISYVSGSWGGDGLVALYNGGATPLRNALTLSNLGATGPNVAIGNFRVTAYAYRNSDNAALDVGMVFADAEDDGSTEYSQGTTNGTTWQVFETKYNSTGEQRLVRSNDGATLRTICGSRNVALAYTKKTASTMVAPLRVNVELAGSGRSATAIGFLLTGSDKGDAPNSYGMSANSFFSTIYGGDPGADGTYYVDGAPTPHHPVGTTGLPLIPRLGALHGDMDYYTSISGELADQDNNTGLNDEDALAPLTPVPVGVTLNTYAINVPVTRDPDKATYINAWMDLNRNGVFDPVEGQSALVTADGYSGFVWNVPPGFTATAGYSYIRVRVHTDPAGFSLGATDSIFSAGETEDYMLPIIQLLPVNLLYLKATEQAGGALLQWKSEKEENFERYYIEASRDGTAFSRIGSVSSQPGGLYQFTDQNAITGINYYRLLMQDMDGKTRYSETVSVKINADNQPQLKLMPNPTQNKITITGLRQDALLRIVNAAGQMLLTQRIDNVHSTVNIGTYADGVYYFLVTGREGQTSTHKIIKR